MSDLLEVLANHGFEIVEDENGQQLVKLVLMDENDTPTGYALVSPEEAKKILDGKATLENILDSEGKHVLTLVPTVTDDQTETDKALSSPDESSNADPNKQSNSMEDVVSKPISTNDLETPIVEPDEDQLDLVKTEKDTAIDPVLTTTDSVASQDAPAEPEPDPTGETNESETAGSGDQYTLSEQSAYVEGDESKQVQVVSIFDANGQLIDQKQGEPGEQVILEIQGQALAYELQGPSPDGEPITSTLIFSAGDPESEQATDPIQEEVAEGPQQTSLDETGQTGTAVTDELGVDTTNVDASAVASNDNDEESSAQPQTSPTTNQPNGQQYTLTEATALINGNEQVQTVILSDEQGNVMDQKQGHTGDHVVIEMVGSRLEYVFMGPSDNGEPITTTLVVTTDSDPNQQQPNSSGPPSSSSAVNQAAGDSSSETEAGTTAANWCPAGLPQEWYRLLRRAAESMATNSVAVNPDGSSVYQPLEAFHRKLGCSYDTFVQMEQIAKTYRVGSARGENLRNYETLRALARIYRSSGPQARALTKHELALNETAAQLCRFHPGLLFHKRDLFHMSKSIVEQTQSALLLSMQQQQQAYRGTGKFGVSAGDLPLAPKPGGGRGLAPSTGRPNSTTTTALTAAHAVSGRVASSQLAMLESRGLSGLHQTASTTPAASSNSLTSFAAAAAASVSNTTSSHAANVTVSLGGGEGQSSLQPVPTTRSYVPTMVDVSSAYYPKRDGAQKLTQMEEDALKAATVDVLAEMHPFPLKPQPECTNMERACWDRARYLTTSASSQSSSAVGSGVSSSKSTGPPSAGTTSGVDPRLTMEDVYNEARVATLRDMAALYGRAPGAMTTSAGLLAVLTPYEAACNEAAALLASGSPAILTHRSVLAEMAKKVVRNSGCLFNHTTVGMDKIPISGNSTVGGYRFYCSEQLPELDLSAAEQLLLDPLDRSSTPDSGCPGSPADNAEAADSVTNNLSMTCEEHNNLIDDVTIFVSTGTDSIRKVRILNFTDCGFTGIVPFHLNYCVNLVELNLSGNALSAFPRCLHLNKLKRLNLSGNPRLLKNATKDPPELPLIEQFPRLVSLEVDPELAELLSRQSLTYFCSHLKAINGQDFKEEASEATLRTAQLARSSLSNWIRAKWDDDIAGFYKKGLPRRDLIRVVETLVLHSVNRGVDLCDHPFTHCKFILARRIAEDFLSAKLLDDDSELEGCGEVARTNEDVVAQEEESSDREDGDDDEPRRDTDLQRRAVEAECEEQAAESNSILLPDEPLDRLANVVGQALLDNKTVVYSVVRSAARQSNGDVIIPVGGVGGASLSSATAGAGPTSSASSSGELQPTPAVKNNRSSLLPPSTPSRPVTSTTLKKPSPATSSLTGRPAPITVKVASATPSKRPIKTIVQQSKRRLQASDYIIKPAQSNAGHAVVLAKSKEALTSLPPPKAPATPVESPNNNQTQAIATPLTSSPTTVVDERPTTVVTPSKAPTTSTKLATPIVQDETAAVAEAEALAKSKLLESITIPPPRPVTTTSSLRMSTRDSNRSKRFCAYGVIDTSNVDDRTLLTVAMDADEAADSAQPPTEGETEPVDGSDNQLTKEQLADVDNDKVVAEQLVDKVTPKTPTKNVITQVSGEEAANVQQPVVAMDQDAVVDLEELVMQPVLQVTPVKKSATPTKISKSASVEEQEKPSTRKRSARQSAGNDDKQKTPEPTAAKRKAVSLSTSTSPAAVRSSGRKSTTDTQRSASKATTAASSDTTTTPTAPTRRKSNRVSAAASSPTATPTPPPPAAAAKGQKAAAKTSPAATVTAAKAKSPLPTSLTQLGQMVDYDPLHFIRCHARDNDPLDCETKVWRCAFEPSVATSSSADPVSSPVVATCGGECVCLIDCRSGRVMKRFKHFGEEFYTLAWTTVQMANDHKTNLLAAAGKLHEIRLLHPEQLVCYAEMRGHQSEIACMLFHPKKPTILFSGDSKASILVWDIGIPTVPEYRTRYQLLMKLACPRPNLNPVLNLVFLPKFDSLVAGCEDGIFSWSLPDIHRVKSNDGREPTYEIKVPTRSEPCFDGLASISDSLLVVKCVEEAELYVVDYGQIEQRLRRASSGSKAPTFVSLDVKGQLKWMKTDEIYINVCARAPLNTVVCGDNQGSIWLYDLRTNVDELTSGQTRKFKNRPIKILEWPECSIGGAREEDSQLKESITSGFKNPVVNTTDISHDGQYLVAVTDNNLVCIWKFSG